MKCSALLIVGRLPANNSSIMKLREASFKILVIIAMKSMNAADITTQHDKFVQGLVLCVSKIDFHAPIISGNTELKRSREKQRLKIQGSVTHDG